MDGHAVIAADVAGGPWGIRHHTREYVMSIHDAITEIVPIIRYTATTQERPEQAVAREYPLTIVFNNHEVATMLCTPKQLDYLTVGFLSAEGFLKSNDKILGLQIDEETGVARLDSLDTQDFDQDILHKRVIPTGGGRGAAFYSTTDLANCRVAYDTKISVCEVLNLIDQFQHSSSVYDSTHGVHSAAICSGTEILAYAEDIGRHNAIDKVIGNCLLGDIPLERLIIITSGRISSEIVRKATKKGFPIIISIAAPTNVAVQLAEKIGITLIASVRGGKMDIYTHAERITGGVKD